MRKVLVTGGAGFVGRHLVRRLLEAGDEVHCVDSLAALTGAVDPEAGWPLFDPRDHRGFHFHHEDCRAYFDRVTDTDFDLAFHLAALVGGRKLIEEQPLALADDLSIDAHYWLWAVRARPARSVIFSSSAVYPVSLQTREHHTPLREDMVRFSEDGSVGIPDLVYGWAKLTMERLARVAHEAHGLRSVVYRPFSGYGEDQDRTYPFPSVLRRVLESRGNDEVRVWGSGDQIRDFIHVEDCVEGVLSTMEAVDDGSAINLSTGAGTSFREFVALAADLLGFAPRVVGTPGTPEGVFARVGETTRQRTLGFEPGVDLRSGIERGLRYLE